MVIEWLKPAPEHVRPVHVSLYGSLSRGDAVPASDVDLLVVRPAGLCRSSPLWAEQRVRLYLAIERGTRRALDLAELGLTELGDFALFNPRLAETVCEEGVTLYGPDLAELYDQIR